MKINFNYDLTMMNFYRLLTDKQNNTLEQVRESMKELHKRGPSIIAVSSMDANDEIVALISSSKGQT